MRQLSIYRQWIEKTFTAWRIKILLRFSVSNHKKIIEISQRPQAKINAVKRYSISWINAMSLMRLCRFRELTDSSCCKDMGELQSTSWSGLNSQFTLATSPAVVIVLCFAIRTVMELSAIIPAGNRLEKCRNIDGMSMSRRQSYALSRPLEIYEGDEHGLQGYP